MTHVPEQSDPQPQHDGPVEVEGAPAEEGISEADVAERVDDDPAEQKNLTDQNPSSHENTEDS